VQVGASSGTLGVPAAAGVDSMAAELTVGPRSPPLILVAAVGGGFCGFAVARVSPAPSGAPKPGPLTLVLVEPSAAPADRESTVVVHVFAVDEKGKPRSGPVPIVVPDAGKLGDVESLGPGAWRTQWTVQARLGATTRVAVAFGSEPPAWGSLSRTPGRPASLDIIEDAASTVEGVPGAVLVQVKDAAGNLTDGVPTLESDRATLEPPVRVERGVYRSRLVLPRGFRGSFNVSATASRIFGSAVLTVSPTAAPATQVSVEPHGPIRADSAAPGQLVIFAVSVADASGDPAKDTPVGVAQLGQFLDALYVAPGSWMLPYRPPRVLEDSVDHVTIRAGGASTQADLQLLAGRFAASVGLKVGMALSGRLGPAAGLEGSAWWFIGRTQLGVSLDVEWWTLSQSSTSTLNGAPATYDARQHFLPAVVSLSWRMLFATHWLLWATGGAGVAGVWQSAQLGGQPAVNEHGLAPAASASLSVGPQAGRGAPFLEVRGTWIGDAKLSTLSGSSTTLLILLGYRFDVR